MPITAVPGRESNQDTSRTKRAALKIPGLAEIDFDPPKIEMTARAASQD